MQPLPFSEAELLNLFILLVHVCLRFIPFRWLFYSVCISYSILDSLSSVVFILCKNVLSSLFCFHITYGSDIYCCWSVNEHILLSIQTSDQETNICIPVYISAYVSYSRLFCFALLFISLFWFRVVLIMMRWSFRASALVDEMNAHTLICLFAMI